MSRTRAEDDTRPSVGEPTAPEHDRAQGRRPSRWRSAGRAVVSAFYNAVFEYDQVAQRPLPKRFAVDPDAHGDAARIADILRIRRRSTPWFLAFIGAWAVGTGAAAVVCAWGAPWSTWLAVASAASLGAGLGAAAASRTLPSVDDAIARLRAFHFRPPTVAERPSTPVMLGTFVLVGLALLPMAGVFTDEAQASAWALSGGLFVGATLTLHRFNARSAVAIAALPESQPALSSAPNGTT